MTDFGQLRNPRNSESTESKLFQTVLSTCITDFQKFTISTPRGRRPTAASATAAKSKSSFTATTAAAPKAVVDNPDEEGASRQASAQQQNGFTETTAERAGVDEAVAGETNISPAKPISEEHLGAHLRLSYTPLSPAHTHCTF
jgi:hypothetical protein